MEAREQEIRMYETEDGNCPFSDWMDDLEGQAIYGVIMNRIDRVAAGNFGDCWSVGHGVFELRIDIGPGYRVYFGRVGSEIVVLLGGGTKKTQRDDIKVAQKHWSAFNAES
ncbi:MAG: type II toxin-antitoxin system RelE/ParE family toxin [Acidobacteria bacterium]|nr:type II toxin-antitoxin system RelE/ParE family toxin [Acidobacteriota bacterium]